MNASRAFLHKMTPCDVVCFTTHFGEMHRDFAISVLCARAKEPPFIKSLLESWRTSPANYTAADLTRWIQRGIAASAEAANKPEEAAQMTQLVTAGAGRSHLGSRALGRDLGVICKKPAGKLALSKKGSRYDFAEASANLDEFLAACRECQNALGERSRLQKMVHTAGTALNKAGKACKALLIGDSGSSVRKGIMRKFVLGYLADGGAVNWDEVSIEDLEAVVPDEGGHLKNLPAGESVSALSMLILGRPDHGMFLSMWACLFAGACAGSSVDSMARTLEKEGGAVVEAWLASHEGTGPRPADLCGELAKRRRTEKRRAAAERVQERLRRMAEGGGAGCSVEPGRAGGEEQEKEGQGEKGRSWLLC